MQFSNKWDELTEIKSETAPERKVNNLIEEWHFAYDGPLGLREYLAIGMHWTQLQASAWLSSKGF